MRARAPGRRPSAAIHSPACRPPSPTRRRSPRSRTSSGPPSRSGRATSRGGRPPRPPWPAISTRPGPPAPLVAALRARIGGRRRPARRGLLPPAPARAQARRRRHLHAGADRRGHGRLGGRRGRARAGRRPRRGLGPLRGGGRSPLRRGPAGRRSSSTRSPRRSAAATSPPRASPGARGWWPATTAPRRSRPRTTPARSSSATRPTCATTRSPPGWKEWLALAARAQGLEASRLAGLHVHFFLATAARAPAGRPGAPSSPPRSGSTPTTAAWCASCCWTAWAARPIHVLEPTAVPFDDAAVTAAITCFRAGRAPGRRCGCGGSTTSAGSARSRAAGRSRPSGCARRAAGRRSPGRPAPSRRTTSSSATSCRVHRGAVTGRNSDLGRAAPARPTCPPAVLFPSVTRAREIFDAGSALSSTGHLRLVVDLPPDLGDFSAAGAAAHRGLPRPRAPRRRPRGLHRPGAAPLVVGRAAGAGADPRDLHGAPPAGLHPQPRRRPAHQHRPRALPARRAPRRRHRPAARLAAPHRERRTTAAPTRAGSPSSSRARWSACPSPTPSPGAPDRGRRVRRPAALERRRARPRHRGGDRGLPARALRGAARAVPRPPRRVPRHHRGADRADGRPLRAPAARRPRSPPRRATSRRCGSSRARFISVDDLRVIAQTSLAPTALRADPEAAARVVETVLAGLDRRRFPWVGEGREPHEDEKSAAALATATLMATERVRTMRRNEARLVQESAVADALPRRRVPRGRRRRASSAPSRRPPGPASSAPSAPSATARPTWWSASGTAGACRSSARPRTRPPTPTSA